MLERKERLTRAAIAAGAGWAERERAALVTEGRLPEGGWPGTMTEARQVAHSSLDERAILPPLTPDERTWMARTTYAEARRKWRTWASEVERAARRNVDED